MQLPEMWELPTLIHVDFDGTLFGTFYTKVVSENGAVAWKSNRYIPRAAIEVTQSLAWDYGYTLIVLSVASAMGAMVSLVEEYYPWLEGVCCARGNKGKYPGIQYLIDDSEYHFKGSNLNGILLDTSFSILPGNKIYSPNVCQITSWEKLARAWGIDYKGMEDYKDD